VADQNHKPLVLSREIFESHFAEAYRALRANISFSSVGQQVKSIVVTSARQGEGKTTTAVNLGIIIAQAGPRVVVVDGDLRRPSLYEAMQANGMLTPRHPSAPGLTNVIVGSAELEEVVVKTPFERLALVPAGPVPPNPSELLGSPRMSELLSDLTEMADYVLIDTPPCLVYSDALVLSPMVDGLLYVLRAGGQDKAAQRRVQKQLQQAKARILGVVFNDVELEEVDAKYGYYYTNGNKHRS
jgi:capsular exopolysaccharide synthesis family protein